MNGRGRQRFKFVVCHLIREASLFLWLFSVRARRAVALLQYVQTYAACDAGAAQATLTIEISGEAVAVCAVVIMELMWGIAISRASRSGTLIEHVVDAASNIAR